MSMCQCPHSSLTSVSFDRGLRLLRCGLHEQQSWELDGRPVERGDVLESLRTVFDSRRGQRRDQPVPVPVPVRAARQPRESQVIQLPHTDDALTAVLQARGISGAWAIA